MAKIKYQPRTPEYEELCRNASELGETNDCSVRAVALVTGQPYAIVHELFIEEGRKPRHGTKMYITTAVLDFLGFNLVTVNRRDMIRQYPGIHKTLKHITSHHPARFNKVWKNGKKYLMRTNSHILAVIDGVNHDWTAGRAFRCTTLYEVVSK
jgi:hypothetical protein